MGACDQGLAVNTAEEGGKLLVACTHKSPLSFLLTGGRGIHHGASPIGAAAAEQPQDARLGLVAIGRQGRAPGLHPDRPERATLRQRRQPGVHARLPGTAARAGAARAAWAVLHPAPTGAGGQRRCAVRRLVQHLNQTVRSLFQWPRIDAGRAGVAETVPFFFSQQGLSNFICPLPTNPYDALDVPYI